MAKKTFYDICGVVLRHIVKDENAIHEQHCTYLTRSSKKEEYEIVRRGDPIFIVDLELGIIKSCVAKIVQHGFGGMVTIKCCEKGHNMRYMPQIDDYMPSKEPFEGCITITVSASASVYKTAATTLDGAISILNMYRNKGNFASLGVGDKIYAVDRVKNTVSELEIKTISKPNNIGDRFKIETTDDTHIIISHKWYEEKASVYSDSTFEFRKKGEWYSSSNVFLFVNKQKAEAFSAARKKVNEKKNILPKEGTDTKLKDSMGNQLYIGDTVAYVDGAGSTIQLYIGKIINNSEKMVKIFDEIAKKRFIEFHEASNKRRIEKGLKPIEYDCSGIGFRQLTTNKVLKIKK